MLLAIHYLRCVTVLALLSVLVACEQKSTAMPDTQARALLLELAQRATDQIQSDQNGVGMATGELTLTEDPDTQANRSSTRSYLCTLWFDPKMYRADWFDPKVPSKRLHCYATGKDLAFQYDETRQILGISDSQYANQGRLGYDGRVMTYQGPQGYHVSNLLGRLAQTKADLTVTLTTTSQGQIIDIQTRITDQTTGLLREKGHYQVLTQPMAICCYTARNTRANSKAAANISRHSDKTSGRSSTTNGTSAMPLPKAKSPTVETGIFICVLHT